MTRQDCTPQNGIGLRVYFEGSKPQIFNRGKLWSIAKHYISEPFYKSLLCIPQISQFPIKLNLLWKILCSIVKKKNTCQEISSLKRGGKYCIAAVFI